MAIYTVELDGQQFDIEGPDGASEADLLGAAQQHQATAQTGQGGPTASPVEEISAPPESRARQFTRKVANALPTAGGIGFPTVAAISSGGLSLPATAGLAGLGAATGTAAKQLILRSLGDTKGVPRTSGEAAKEIGLTGAKDAAITAVGGKLIKGGIKGARLAKDLITKPGAGEVALAGKEALLDISERGGEKLALARTTREAAKKGLISAEEKAGLHFESTQGFEDFLRDPKKMAGFSQKIGRLAKQTPEELAQSIPSEQLQLFRKIAQEGEKVSTLSDISKSQMRQGKDIFTQALGLKEKGMGEALGTFREANQVVGEIPGEIKQKLISSKMRTAREVLDAKGLDKKRKVIKNLAYAAAGYAGLRGIFK